MDGGWLECKPLPGGKNCGRNMKSCESLPRDNLHDFYAALLIIPAEILVVYYLSRWPYARRPEKK